MKRKCRVGRPSQASVHGKIALILGEGRKEEGGGPLQGSYRVVEAEGTHRGAG